jgi:hypothetical protein
LTFKNENLAGSKHFTFWLEYRRDARLTVGSNLTKNPAAALGE